MQDKASIRLTNLSLTGSEEKMMASLTASIIPTTKNFMGAAEVKAHEFALMMIDDCESPETQKKFMEWMKAFDKMVDAKYDKSFDKLSEAQKKELLTRLESKTDVGEDVQQFYSATKMYTIQAFTSSENYMSNIRKYKMVPGSNFKGCVPVASV
jgi:hypothetical protein